MSTYQVSHITAFNDLFLSEKNFDKKTDFKTQIYVNYADLCFMS